MINCRIFFIKLLFIFSLTKPIDVQSKKEELKNCLTEQWGIDQHTIQYIVNKFNPLFNLKHISVVQDFIIKSKKINIDFSRMPKISSIYYQDGVIKAPNQHIILFENPWIRILFGSTQPQEKENYHVHIWKSLMVIIKPTTYEIKYLNGVIEIGDWPIGVYDLPENEGYECTNIGNSADESLRFEIKN